MLEGRAISRIGGFAGLLMAVWLGVPEPAHAARPPLLEGQAGCVDYLGMLSGNDPSVRIHLQLCESEGAVRGRLQWSSLTSGWNVREVEGRYVGDQFIGRDIRIISERANPGWRFCEVSRYELTRTSNALNGTYLAPDCDDHATLRLQKIDPPAGQAGQAPAATPQDRSGVKPPSGRSEGMPGNGAGQPSGQPSVQPSPQQPSGQPSPRQPAPGQPAPGATTPQPLVPPPPPPQSGGFCQAAPLANSTTGPAGVLLLLIVLARRRQRPSSQCNGFRSLSSRRLGS